VNSADHYAYSLITEYDKAQHQSSSDLIYISLNTSVGIL
jgi:hypothetical protein